MPDDQDPGPGTRRAAPYEPGPCPTEGRSYWVEKRDQGPGKYRSIFYEQLLFPSLSLEEYGILKSFLTGHELVIHNSVIPSILVCKSLYNFGVGQSVVYAFLDVGAHGIGYNHLVSFTVGA
jgi:hypothetical protein